MSKYLTLILIIGIAIISLELNKSLAIHRYQIRDYEEALAMQHSDIIQKKDKILKMSMKRSTLQSKYAWVKELDFDTVYKIDSNWLSSILQFSKLKKLFNTYSTANQMLDSIIFNLEGDYLIANRPMMSLKKIIVSNDSTMYKVNVVQKVWQENKLIFLFKDKRDTLKNTECIDSTKKIAIQITNPVTGEFKEYVEH